MTAVDWLVLLGATATIGWVNWYFFLAERGQAAVAVGGAGNGATDAATAASTAGVPGVPGVPEVVIEVQGGYEPRTVRVPAGRPVRLVFDRRETSSCSEEVVFADFGVRKFLPAHERTVVELTPPAPGTYEFTCGMAMLRGRLIAE